MLPVPPSGMARLLLGAGGRNPLKVPAAPPTTTAYASRLPRVGLVTMAATGDPSRESIGFPVPSDSTPNLEVSAHWLPLAPPPVKVLKMWPPWVPTYRKSLRAPVGSL